jgi:hypothetical protein
MTVAITAPEKIKGGGVSKIKIAVCATAGACMTLNANIKPIDNHAANKTVTNRGKGENNAMATPTAMHKKCAPSIVFGFEKGAVGKAANKAQVADKGAIIW